MNLKKLLDKLEEASYDRHLKHEHADLFKQARSKLKEVAEERDRFKELVNNDKR